LGLLLLSRVLLQRRLQLRNARVAKGHLVQMLCVLLRPLRWQLLLLLLMLILMRVLVLLRGLRWGPMRVLLRARKVMGIHWLLRRQG
jgi:hypothetical protein